MNDNGKFKKKTIIIMLVAVFISVCSLAWVLIFKGDDSYQETNKAFYDETAPTYTQKAQSEEPTDEDDGSKVKITVPVSFVLEGINADSQLTDEQEELGFKSVVSEGNDSVTYTISKYDYEKFLRSYRYEITAGIEDALWRSYPYFKELDFNDELTRFVVTVESADYNSAEGESIAELISRQAEYYRAYSMLNAGCTVVFEDYATRNAITTYNY